MIGPLNLRHFLDFLFQETEMEKSCHKVDYGDFAEMWLKTLQGRDFEKTIFST